MTIIDNQLQKLNVPNLGETCLRLIKSLYGLKQADCGITYSNKRWMTPDSHNHPRTHVYT